MSTTASKFFILAIAAFVTLGAAKNASAGSSVGILNGTWEVTGTPDSSPCAPPPFVNLVSITRDGKIINVDPEVGTGVGEAYRISRKTYVAGFFGFINTGQVILRYEVQGELKVINRGEIDGVFLSTIYDPANNPVCQYTGTLEGFRLVPMPL